MGRLIFLLYVYSQDDQVMSSRFISINYFIIRKEQCLFTLFIVDIPCYIQPIKEVPSPFMIRVGHRSLMVIRSGHLYLVHNPISITLYKERHDPSFQSIDFLYVLSTVAPLALLLLVKFSDFSCFGALAS